jgi:hypothetical protein
VLQVDVGQVGDALIGFATVTIFAEKALLMLYETDEPASEPDGSYNINGTGVFSMALESGSGFHAMTTSEKQVLYDSDIDPPTSNSGCFIQSTLTRYYNPEGDGDD